MRRLLSFLSMLVTAMIGTVVVAASPAAAQPNGLFYIVNELSGKCLDQNYTGGVAHREVYAWTCNYGTNQKWQLQGYSNSDDIWFYLRNFRSGQCLNQDFSGGVEHSNVIAYKCSSDLNNLWYANWVTTRRSYMLGSLKTNKCLDQSYTGGNPGTAILAWSCKSTNESVTNQHWVLVPAFL